MLTVFIADNNNSNNSDNPVILSSAFSHYYSSSGTSHSEGLKSKLLSSLPYLPRANSTPQNLQQSFKTPRRKYTILGKLKEKVKKVISHPLDFLIALVNKIRVYFLEIILPVLHVTKKITGNSWLGKEIEKIMKRVINKYTFFIDFNYTELEDKILRLRSDLDFPVFNYYSRKLDESPKPIYDMDCGIKTYQTIVNLYVQRFLKQHPDMTHPSYLPSLHLIALRIAIKDSIDGFYAFDHLNQFLPPRIGGRMAAAMERYFLQTINWNISIQELANEEEDSNCSSSSSSSNTNESSDYQV